MSEHDFKPGDMVKFRADAGEVGRSFHGADGGIRVIPAGEAVEVVAMPDGLPESLRKEYLVVAWSGYKVAIRRACLEPADPRPACNCDIRVLTSGGCKCGGR